MKQGNLFDAFSKSKKKGDVINSQSSVQSTSQSVSTASTGMVVETTETVKTETNIMKTEIQLNEESIEHSSSKKRKSTVLVNSVLEEVNKDQDLEIVQRSVKKIKLNIDETEEEPTLLKVTISQEPNTNRPPKDLSKLKKINDPEYNAYHDAPFWPGENVPFCFLTECFDEVSLIKGENSKDKIIEIIGNMFRSILLLTPDQLPLAYYFCILKVAPDYETFNELGKLISNSK